eukprot:800875-Prorocentrum_lima.AAC.1
MCREITSRVKRPPVSSSRSTAASCLACSWSDVVIAELVLTLRASSSRSRCKVMSRLMPRSMPRKSDRSLATRLHW